jgi:two-component system, OmpR family, sensor histidine kinase VicK
LILESVAEYSIEAKKRNVLLRCDIAGDLSFVSLDSRRINQVIGNLLSNALKFTESGGTIDVTACSGAAGEVAVCVKDSGVGIPPEENEHIFETYRQFSAGKNAIHKGTGLGLAICKKIVEAHGGRIWVESEEGKGTSVFFSLPVATEMCGVESSA